MNFFDKNNNFTIDDGVYCQKNFRSDEFQKEYVGIRTKEGRMYDDTTVKELPSISREHSLYKEWKIRKASADKLIARLKEEMCGSVMEVGCGNGWLTRYIQGHINIPAYGIDIGLTELKQAARISNGRAAFVYGDILSGAFHDLKVDTIVLAACAQYFCNLKSLVDTLLQMLDHKGSIHIIDTPFYKTGIASNARSRSATYFRSKDAAGMEPFYYHHEIDELKDLNAEFLYQPTRIKKLMGNSSPFPWIRIRKEY